MHVSGYQLVQIPLQVLIPVPFCLNINTLGITAGFRGSGRNKFKAFRGRFQQIFEADNDKTGGSGRRIQVYNAVLNNLTSSSERVWYFKFKAFQAPRRPVIHITSGCLGNPWIHKAVS